MEHRAFSLIEEIKIEKIKKLEKGIDIFCRACIIDKVLAKKRDEPRNRIQKMRKLEKFWEKALTSRCRADIITSADAIYRRKKHKRK